MLDYDLILPIGERCHTKVALLELFPNMPINLFDTFGNLSLDSVYDIMKNHFDNFLLKEDLRFISRMLYCFAKRLPMCFDECIKLYIFKTDTQRLT